MKNLKIILILILPVLLMSSKCVDKKNNDAENFQIIKGRLMVDCNTPYASSKVQLRSLRYGFNGPAFCEDVNGNTEFYTDENGYFEINYRKEGYDGMIYAPFKVMESIPLTEAIMDIGEVNLGGTIDIQIKLQVNNTYTANDTLYYYDWNYPKNGANHWMKKLAGPFASGVIDSVVGSSYIKYPLVYNQPPVVDVSYYVNSFQNNIDVPSSLDFCNGVLSETILTIN